MLQVARLAPKLLGDSSNLVREFLRREQNDDGGFKDRTGKSDLYYTVFGIDGLLALQAEIPVDPIASFLTSFGDGDGLDFVHLCCLARCWAAISHSSKVTVAVELQSAIFRHIEQFRTEDGGYHPASGATFGTVYGCFLAFGAYQDLKSGLPNPLRLVQCLKFLETDDGAWANERTAVAERCNG